MITEVNYLTFLTASQKMRAERATRVCENYKALRAKYPAAPISNLLETVAEQVCMSASGVRHILQQQGLYDAKKH